MTNTPLPFPQTLQCTHLRLEAFSDSHLPGLYQAASHPELWTFFKPPSQPLQSFLDTYFFQMTQMHPHNSFAYTLFREETGEILGSTRYYDCSPENKRVAIGFTWIAPQNWQSGINPKAKFLLLSHIFETLNWNRVEFYVDSRNQRSLGALTKLGATKEGLLRKHKITQGDYVRDTVVLGIVKEEWPGVRRKLIKNAL